LKEKLKFCGQEQERANHEIWDNHINSEVPKWSDNVNSV